MFFYIIIITAPFVVLDKEVEAVKKYNHVGCYETTDRSRLLYQHVKKFDKLTPKVCADWCQSQHMAYAGLQKSECRCGQYQPNEMIRRSFKDCGYPCPGDRKTKCGGDYRTSVYETGIIATGDEAIPARAYLGCYPDNDTDYRILKGSIRELPDNTPSKCHKICYQQGFRYFGLSDVKFCFCGDTPASKEKAIPGENCQSICNGDDNKYCGGNQKLSLYATGITNIPEFGRYLGCFDNTNLEDIKTEIMLNLTLTNSQGRCFNICDQKGFKYAGVQRGSLCMCLNKEPSASFEEDYDECEVDSCLGELTDEYCGAKDVMKVFRTRRTDEIQAVEVDYQGCYKDQKHFPTLDGYKEIFGKNLSPGLCVETCKFKGFAFSGVESGTECYCSHSYPTIHAKVDDKECNLPCSGNPKESCGGKLRIAVYDNGIPHPQAFVNKFYMGCYKDDVLGVKLLEGTSSDMGEYLSPTVCYKQCLLTGFLYFGLIRSSDESEKCLCSDNDPPQSLLTDENECQRKCSGDSNKVCGNDWRVAIYRTGLSDEQSKYIYKGCYQNDEYVLIDRETDHSESLIPRRCYRLCDMLGFVYFGVEQGKICRCGNDLAVARTPESEDNCRIRCPGNASETCGGHKKYMQIYQITSNSEENKVGSSKDPIFVDNFNTLDTSIWSYTIKIAHEPNYEFVTYERCQHVVFPRDGKLFIKPKIQPYDSTQNSITLENCTGKPIECTKKAQGYRILPPIQSGQLSTKNSFSFRYGKIEVRAKLPMGDWIVPEIWLMPTKQEYGDYYQSGQIRIAMARGNKDLNCFDNHYGHKRLEMGVYIGQETETKRKVFYKMASDSWSKEFHNYTVIWAPEKISFQVDNEEIGTIQSESHQTIRQIVGMPENTEYIYANAINKLAPFDREFHLTFGISVGGVTDFSDDCVANPKKPWSNTSPKAMLNFWKAKEQWINTWIGDNSALQIEHVIVRPL